MPENIYLVRHATPDWSRSDLVYHLPPGPPLTIDGRRQAAALGAFLIHANVHQIYSSPLDRCLHTAQIVSTITGVPVEVDQALIEWQPGDQPSAVRSRIRPILEKAAALSSQVGPIALFTHGGPIGALLLEMGMDEETLSRQRIFDHHNPVPTAGAWLASRSLTGEPWELRLAFKPEIAASATI